jgi:hypothetical protein
MTILELIKTGDYENIDFSRYVQFSLDAIANPNSFIHLPPSLQDFSTTLRTLKKSGTPEAEAALKEIFQKVFSDYDPQREHIFKTAVSAYQENSIHGNILVTINNNALLKMLAETDFDENIQIKDLNFPFSHFYLHYHSIVGDVFIEYEAFISIDDNLNITPFISYANDGKKLYKPAHDKIVNGKTFSMQSISHLVNQIKQEASNEPSIDKANALEGSIPINSFELICKLIVYMATPQAKEIIVKKHPELKRHGTQQLRAKRPAPKPLFSNIVYRYETSGSQEGKKYQSPFLVRGHFRNQRYGPQRANSRIIWIQPFFKGTGSNIEEKEYKL